MKDSGAAKPKDNSLPSDLKAGGAPQGGGDKAPAVARNHAPAGDTGAEAGDAKVAAPAAYKEDSNLALAKDSQKQSELGARGVPLGRNKAGDHKAVPQNDQAAQLKDEERSIDGNKDTMENLQKEMLEKEAKVRTEIEQLEREKKEKLERDIIEKGVQAKLEKERQEKLAMQQQLEKEKAEKERIEKEVQARVEKERMERERREKLAREQELEKEKLEQEKAAEERRQQELQRVDNEMAKKEQHAAESQERLAQLQQAMEAKKAEKSAQGGEGEDGEALKKGGRDLKENPAAPSDPREGVEGGAVKAESHFQGSHEKMRDQGDTDLRRRRRELGPGDAAAPLEDSKASMGVPGLEPLLELGPSNLHAALEEQLIAGAILHSRQIKQASEDDGVK